LLTSKEVEDDNEDEDENENDWGKAATKVLEAKRRMS
jgi:hypothetical protein